MTEKQEGPTHFLREVWNDEATRSIVKVAVAIVVAVIGLYLLNYLIPISFLSRDPAHWAEFGDYFGGVVNPLLGFLTLILVIATVYYTKKMLDTTREEMKNAQKEMARQNLDSRMFFLIRMLREVKDNIRVRVHEVDELERLREEERFGSAALYHEFKKPIDAFTYIDQKDITKNTLRYLSGTLQDSFMKGSNARQYITCLLVILKQLERTEYGQDHAELIGALVEEPEAVIAFLYAKSDISSQEDEQLIVRFLIDHVMRHIEAYTYSSFEQFMIVTDDWPQDLRDQVD